MIVYNFNRYHAFVVFETEKWWWSIEKNDGGITLQRPAPERNQPVSLVMLARGRGSISDLADFLWSRDHLNKTYDFLFENCNVLQPLCSTSPTLRAKNVWHRHSEWADNSPFVIYYRFI